MDSGSPSGNFSPPPSQAPPPPPLNTFQDPITSRVKRVKSIWRLLMITNIGIAAFALIAPLNKKEPIVKEDKALKPVTESLDKKEPVIEEEKAPQPDKPLPEDFDYDHYIDIVPSSISSEPLPPEPISELRQKELFQWMLDEKRKIKPKDKVEKRRIDSEKAILKQFIRATPHRPI